MSISISLDPARQDLDAIHGMLAATYWSPHVRREVVDGPLRNSIKAVALDDATGATVGLARVVTDRATFAWLCDVVVVEPWRGQGLSCRLIGSSNTIRRCRRTAAGRWPPATPRACTRSSATSA